ncbi:hypothetical protein NM688_g5875 [Phlebia brevispora]|uniref:Uncharacterized protein n=1 Tax=Phlebia brevispora TaxID=194682 RepID=A0ACC1SNT1_9APHY|nr:hypothetical protein NM688_g5875 [Phlebia brevispora]
MAVSDNVLNSAFVPQDERQATGFVKALTFTPRSGDAWRLKHGEYAKSDTGRTQLYAPPLEEFVVLHTQLPIGTTETLKASHGPTIGIVTRGQALVTVGQEFEDLNAGGIVFVAPGHDIQIEPFENPQNQAEIWWASSMV